jgi:asparagine synthase (glutamine-hydrolysing)
MCGICGWFGLPPDPARLTAMLSTLVRRGPDEEGRYTSEECTLGMRRLAIIDVGGGHQPRFDPITGTRLVYNGEIYNHQDIRRELEARGHALQGNSDSEVLLHAWLEWGEGCLDKLNGMFAFALWDPKRKRMVLARDHLGQKPLHYRQKDRTLIFGSELRTVIAYLGAGQQINYDALADYLRLRHVPGPQTMFKGVYQLPPGSILTMSADGDFQVRRYWRPQFKPDPTMNLDSAVDEFLALWRPAIRRHLISDVPVGAFLSGGIDSSLVVAEAGQAVEGFRTFSIAFGEKGFDETPHALVAARALNCRHEVFRFEESLPSLLDEWAIAYDQPFSDPAAFPSLILAREARARITVALTGDGGDELFAGYQRYRSTLLARRLAQLPRPVRRASVKLLRSATRLFPTHAPAHRWLDAVTRRLGLIEADVSQEYLRQFQIWDESLLTSLMVVPPQATSLPPLEDLDLLSAMLAHDLEHWLPDQMLVKLDRATMSHSLEARLPFLDRDIVEFSLRVPPSLQLAGGVLKRVLREAALRRIPRQLAFRPKQGFVVPIDRWLRAEKNYVEDFLRQGLLSTRFPLRTEAILKLWREHRDEHANHGERLLTLLILLSWERVTWV